jgi:hypothetical protein
MRTILLASLATLGLVGSARAERPEGTGSPGSSLACRQEDETQPVTTRVERINGKPTLVIEKEIVICGRPARPAVAYVTSPKDVDYTWTQLTEDLASKIVSSVSKLGGRK